MIKRRASGDGSRYPKEYEANVLVASFNIAKRTLGSVRVPATNARSIVVHGLFSPWSCACAWTYLNIYNGAEAAGRRFYLPVRLHETSKLSALRDGILTVVRCCTPSL